MQRVLVIDKSKNPLMPCHPARARGLLAQRKAVVYNFKPFTIMLIDRVGGEKQVVELKFDPGSKVTGIAAVIVGKHGRAAAVNASRYAIVDALHVFNLPVGKASGGRTKYNRVQQKYTKAHWIDAACVGETGNQIKLNLTWQALEIKACGRGTRQVCRVNRFGFPRTSAKTKKLVQGFKTGDLVKALVTKGKKIGKYFGKVAIRAWGVSS